MVDKVSFQDQNQNCHNNIILCEHHKSKCKTFKLDSQQHNNIFRCHTCMIQEKQDYSQIVPLSQVCQYDHSTIILSWPPLDDQTLLNKVFQISQQSNPKQTECDKIVEFFDQFTNEILSKISDKKKSILSQSEIIADSSQSIQKVYQQIASFQELKEIIQDDNMNITKKSECISNLIQKKNSERTKNTQLINDWLEQQNFPKCFDPLVFNTFKTTLISQIELLDYHNQTTIQDISSFTQQFLQIHNSFNIPNQVNNQVEIQKESNLDRIIKLISNKSNSCSEKYLNSVKFELNKLQIMINSLNIEKDVFQPNKQQTSIDFTHLESDQIENIQILTEKIKMLNQQYNQINNYSNKNTLNEQFQPSSFFVMEKIFKLSQLLTQQKLNKIENLLKIYPIFEVEQIVKPMKYSFKIELSKYNYGQKNGQVSFDDDGLQNFGILVQGYTVSHIRINQNCRYRIRIKLYLNNQENRHFFIGLIKDQDKDNKYIHDKSIINSFNISANQGDSGVSKVKKGRCLRQIKYPEQYNEIEVRFCVKERLFEVSDYPKRENINIINDDKINMIDPNFIYHLGLELLYVGDKISILEFEEENVIE